MTKQVCSYCYGPCRYSAARGKVCESCYLESMYGFARNRRDAERLSNIAGRNFVVVEIDPAAPASVRCAKLGRKAYAVWSALAAKDMPHSRVIEEYAPGVGRVFQALDVP